MVAPLDFSSAPRPPSAPSPAPSARPTPPADPDRAFWAAASQEDPRIAAALNQVRGLLVAGERPWAYTLQRRWFALTHRRVLVVATSGRLIVFARRLLGGYRMLDVRWQDVLDVTTQAGLIGANLALRRLSQPDQPSQAASPQALLVTGLRKSPTAEVYRLAQGQEQAWREKRRARELEETRARSGGIQWNAGGSPRGNDGTQESAMVRLERAKTMLDQGLISDSEYETVKTNILREL